MRSSPSMRLKDAFDDSRAKMRSAIVTVSALSNIACRMSSHSRKAATSRSSSRTTSSRATSRAKSDTLDNLAHVHDHDHMKEELKAMRRIHDVLAKLDPPARLRVVEYIRDAVTHGDLDDMKDDDESEKKAAE